MRRGHLSLAVLWSLCSAVHAQACPPPAGFDGTLRAESRDFVVYYRADPAPFDVGRLFAIEAVACAKQSAVAVSGLAMDATMPEHRHGMNYRPTVTALGNGRYRIDGLLFHMPGRWQLVFDVDAGPRRERLAADVEIE